jgi:hypothetical protein
MKMQKSSYIFLFLLANSLLVTPIFAQDVATTTTTSTLPIVPLSSPTTAPTSTPSIEPPILTSTAPLLIQKIQQAKDMLKDLKLDYTVVTKYKTVKKKKVISGYSTDQESIALAVYDPSADTITIIRGTQHGKKFTFNDPLVSVQASRFNGVNTPFKVTKPAGGIVVALKYLITPLNAPSKKSVLSQLREVIYTPYSEVFNTKEIYDLGAAYVESIIQQAIDQLHDMRSQRSSGLSVAAAVNPALIKSLVYSEHMDQGELVKNPDTQGLINRLNVLFAINDGDTFRYSASTANAKGIAQFIPSTYKSLVKRYPEAHLIPDFDQGMEDHENSLVAAFLLFDDYTAGVKRGLSGTFIDSEAPYYGAAAYNGGITRIVRAVKQFGDAWSNAGNKPKTKALKAETVGYVAKIRKLFAVFNG